MPALVDFERLGLALYWALHHPLGESNRAAVKIIRVGRIYQCERTIRRPSDDVAKVFNSQGDQPWLALEAMNLRMDEVRMGETELDRVKGSRA
jgi:hypothetical protein